MVEIKISSKCAIVLTLKQLKQECKCSSNLVDDYLQGRKMHQTWCVFVVIVLVWFCLLFFGGCLLFICYREIAGSPPMEWWCIFKQIHCMTLCLLSITGKALTGYTNQPVDVKLLLTLIQFHKLTPNALIGTLVSQKQQHSNKLNNCHY